METNTNSSNEWIKITELCKHVKLRKCQKLVAIRLQGKEMMR